MQPSHQEADGSGGQSDFPALGFEFSGFTLSFALPPELQRHPSAGLCSLKATLSSCFSSLTNVKDTHPPIVASKESTSAADMTFY